ncbi:hypothetical protein VHEMI04519 [[Torrubiella] hemipterigena]|uniref:Uncharacterized protein n=1 Tax=[Torrubiella] hemipterigena TaxID=1531966 RepID=A0A0A1TE27_9HYPO|nr:hypothetical protein VHEMI04519 [[Torrubiella] hemipterigena]
MLVLHPKRHIYSQASSTVNLFPPTAHYLKTKLSNINTSCINMIKLLTPLFIASLAIAHAAGRPEDVQRRTDELASQLVDELADQEGYSTRVEYVNMCEYPVHIWRTKMANTKSLGVVPANETGYDIIKADPKATEVKYRFARTKTSYKDGSGALELGFNHNVTERYMKVDSHMGPVIRNPLGEDYALATVAVSGCDKGDSGYDVNIFFGRKVSVKTACKAIKSTVINMVWFCLENVDGRSTMASVH